MKKSDYIAKIIEAKKNRILAQKAIISEEELKAKALELKPIRSLKSAISKPGSINLIGEIKKASPSRGMIRQNLDVVAVAKAYVEGGAQALSVLTEEDFFLGSLDNLKIVREVVSLPILRKDFILDPFQVYESRVIGADCILLIVSILSKDKLIELMDLAKSVNLECLVEIHDEAQLKRVLSLKREFILGINNRNLDNFEVDLKTSEKILPFIPKGNTIVVESGIKNYQDVLFLKLLRVNAVLIGEAFMRASDIASEVKEVMGW
jgi:indole-3-glycerol phosphate synthase